MPYRVKDGKVELYRTVEVVDKTWTKAEWDAEIARLKNAKADVDATKIEDSLQTHIDALEAVDISGL